MKRTILVRSTWLLMSAAVFVCALLALEVVFRAIDGFRLGPIPLRRSSPLPPPVRHDGPDRRYAIKIPRAASVSLDWYTESPKPIERIPLTQELQARAKQYPDDPYAPFFEWNLAFLRDEACKGERATTMGNLRDFYYFESIDRSRYPAYRHLRRISPPFWFVTNSFGWRGPDIALNKGPDTIRIAFVGASTTIDAYAYQFSHPELVEYWLTRWAAAKRIPYRFEVINAGRTGIDSQSIAAVVTQELVPVEPDLVVFYEGANQFWPARMLRLQDSRTYPQPRVTYWNRAVAEKYSALVRRVMRMADRVRAGDGREPSKPASMIDWPAGVDEFDPPLDSLKLPMDLPVMVRDLDTMRIALASIGSALVVSSFVWMVDDGMQLDPDGDLTLYYYLNRNYWPVTYADMRRLADFQNRVFEKYARTHRLPFIDMAAAYPRDPSLAGDAVGASRFRSAISSSHLARPSSRSVSVSMASETSLRQSPQPHS